MPEGQTAEDAAAAKVISMSLLIHVQLPPYYPGKRLVSLKSFLLFSLEQTAGLTPALTDPFVKAASKVATLHHMLYWAL